MAQFTKVTSKVAVLPVNDVDTDQIIPARFLKVIDKQGLGKHAFSDWRYLADGSPNPDFVLNRPSAQGSEILLAGDNFGCGSSREHAPWALLGWGLKAVISTSFADIFRNNSLKNGLLPVEVDAETHARLLDLVQRQPGAELTIDLTTRTLTGPEGLRTSFPIDSFSQHCLLQGIDQLGYIMSFQDRIEAFERAGV